MAEVTQRMLEGVGWGVAHSFRLRRRYFDETPRVMPSESPESVSQVTRTIEAEIIPRLVLAHRTTPAVAQPQSDIPFSEAVVEFAEIVVKRDVEAGCDYVETHRAAGEPLEALYFGLVAPAAGYIRYLWRNDLCDFSDATLALWRLQQVLREFSTTFRADGGHAANGLRALLVPSPGEKHDLGYLMFGLVLVGEFFRRDGWDAWIEPDPASHEFASLVRNQWFDVVQYNATGDKKLDELAASIRMARRDSPNRSLGVMVCGRVFVEHPELVLVVGADMTVNDPRQGVLHAHDLVARLPRV